ncbi:MAG: class I SAM-dependent methyltransferase [Spirochaetia bacterium]|nr:class I SAM-dependent methyltransferase [Spirochaetia bacterium]
MRKILVNSFFNLTNKYGPLRRIVWKPIYEMLARQFKYEEWQFMNYGYKPLKNEPLVKLHKDDEINRYPIQSYHYLANKVKLKGLKVLEVGSGRGGGASFIKRYHFPSKMIGMDIAKSAVKLARKHHPHDGLEFIEGNAEKIHFEDNSFDVIINVESSHAYGSELKFFNEVKRILKPGGYFLCTDLRDKHKMEIMKKNLLKSGLELLEEEDITENVIMAMEEESDIKNKRINEKIPKLYLKNFKEFAGVVGSAMYLNIKNRHAVYYRFTLQKKKETKEAKPVKKAAKEKNISKTAKSSKQKAKSKKA